MSQTEPWSAWRPRCLVSFQEKISSSKPLQYVKAVDSVSFRCTKTKRWGWLAKAVAEKQRWAGPVAADPANLRQHYYDNREMGSFNKQELAALRKDIQIVFQDPILLNPRMTIRAAITEPMKVHRLETSEKTRRDRVVELLEKVNLQAAHFNRYPHEFSGGQRQRIVIARALASILPLWFVTNRYLPWT